MPPQLLEQLVDALVEGVDTRTELALTRNRRTRVGDVAVGPGNRVGHVDSTALDGATSAS